MLQNRKARFQVSYLSGSRSYYYFFFFIQVWCSSSIVLDISTGSKRGLSNSSTSRVKNKSAPIFKINMVRNLCLFFMLALAWDHIILCLR